MNMKFYDPDLRAAEKAAARERDEEALASGLVSRDALQNENGGYGLFRASRLVRGSQVATQAAS